MAPEQERDYEAQLRWQNLRAASGLLFNAQQLLNHAGAPDLATKTSRLVLKVGALLDAAKGR